MIDQIKQWRQENEEQYWGLDKDEVRIVLNRFQDAITQNAELRKALKVVRDTLSSKKNDDRTSWGLWDVANKALERSKP